MQPGGGASESQAHISVYAADGGGGSSGDQVVEEASPISSRPPANLEELMRLSADEGGGGGSGSSGNRWPREETLGLLKIRREMDAAFRDSTVKGPLWEDVSRKLGELGYKRSAKKCKEKFENVQKYYKRTKDGRGGRQDGKSYKFFTQLEALNNITSTTSTIPAPPPPPPPVTASTSNTFDPPPLTLGALPPPNPMHISPHRSSNPPGSQSLSTIGMMTSSPYTNLTTAAVPAVTSFGSAPMVTAPLAAPPAAPAATSFGITFASNNSSSTASSSRYDDDEMDVEASNIAGTSSRKRKRYSSKESDRSSSRKMMGFFERLMGQVMQKQEAMQRSFLEALEKREQDRLHKEEAWKRQEMARLARDHELKAQERATSASRDAAIVSLIQKITGQTIQLPPPITVSTMPTPPPPPPPQPQAQPALATWPVPITPMTPSFSSPFQQKQKSLHPQDSQAARHQPSSMPSQVQAVMAIPEQQIPPSQQQKWEQQQETGASGSSEPASSRWPKAEVLALIDLRSGLESTYEEAGSKGPLWEEISTGMKRMGYNRSSKRCKEKWENINKYFKKVKENNKKRPEDAKTCPYFHQLDALYRNKVLGSSSSFGIQQRPQEQRYTQQPEVSFKADPAGPAMKPPDETNVPANASASEPENKNVERVGFRSPGSLFGEGNEGAGKEPEGIVMKLMDQQGMPAQRHLHEQQQLMVDDYEKIEGAHSYNLDDQEGEDDEEDEEVEEDGKMGYKIEFQQRNTSASNRGGGSGGAPSFLTMVQ